MKNVGRKVLFVGYCKGDEYSILLNDTNRVVEWKDVIFFERFKQRKNAGTIEYCIQFGDVESDVRLDELQVTDLIKLNGGIQNSYAM